MKILICIATRHPMTQERIDCTMPAYPSKTEIEQLCSHLASDNPAPFFDRVSPNVIWDVMGALHCPPIRPIPHAGW